MTEPLLTEQEAAPLLAVSVRTLQKWRQKGKGPEYRKLGEGKRALVRYTRAALDAYARKGGIEQ